MFATFYLLEGTRPSHTHGKRYAERHKYQQGCIIGIMLRTVSYARLLSGVINLDCQLDWNKRHLEICQSTLLGKSMRTFPQYDIQISH